MSQQRTQRIEAEIQRLLAALISREVKDPRVGNVTITQVSLTPDMGSARVYFTPFASSQPAEQVQAGLTHAAGFLRGELGRRLGLRHAPRLEFRFDDTVEGAARLTSLIERAVEHDRAAEQAAEGDPSPGAGAPDSPQGPGGDPARR
jgi:ribosome-binding factor A